MKVNCINMVKTKSNEVSDLLLANIISSNLPVFYIVVHEKCNEVTITEIFDHLKHL